MIGTILLILLGLILLTLIIALLLPISLRISYESRAVHLVLSYAGKCFTLYPKAQTDEPRQEKEEKSQKEKKTPGKLSKILKKRGLLSKEKRQKKAEKSSKKNKTKEERKTGGKINWEQISYSLDVLPGVLVRALSRTRRRIRITPLKIHVLVAGKDPADTAVLYGKLQGVLAGTLPALHRAVRIKNQDIRLFPDFTQERMDFIADVGVRIRFWDVLVVAFGAAGGALKWFIGFRKRATREIENGKAETKESAGADNAA